MMTRVSKGKLPEGRPDGDTGEYIYVHRRAEDRSFLVKTSYLIDKYKPIIWLLILLALAIGFDFKTPRTIMSEFQNQLNSLKVAQSQGNNERLEIKLMVRYLVAKECIIGLRDPEIQRSIQLAGINCSRVLNPDPEPTPQR